MKRRWWRSGIIQFLLGAGTIYGFSVLLRVATTAPIKMPPGWKIIRPPNDVFALTVLDDAIWAGGKDGLTAIDRRTAQVRALPGNVPNMQYVKDLLVDRAGTLWAGHIGGLTTYSHGTWQSQTQLEKLLPGSILSLMEDREGVVWVGGENGVVRYDGGFKPLSIPDDLKLPSIDVLFQDRSGAVWLGCAPPVHGGLLRYQDGRWQSYGIQDGLAHNSVNDIVQDHEGALWFALGFADHGGASRLFQGLWTSLKREDGLAGSKVRSMYEDRDGRLWFGSEYEGIAVRSGDQWRVLTPRVGLAGWEVKAMVQDSDGVYWLGTENGISRIVSIDWDHLAKGQ
jgi:ligand-binding sensor domain-containing protein